MNTAHPRLFLRTTILTLIVCLAGWKDACAQVTGLPQSWLDMIEQWDAASDSPMPLDEVEDLFERFSAQPICLNDTVGDGLRQLFFVTPFQCAALKAYIEQQGALLSVEELSLVPGFDAAAVALLCPVVSVCGMSTSSPFSFSDSWRRGHHSLVVGSSGTVERARGYRERVYEGDPYRLYWRYRYRVGNHVQLQLSADKDAGEALFSASQPQGFDHYGFHLQLNEIGHLKRLVVGDYNLQFGQGTTLWTGFAPYSILGDLGYRSARGITPSSGYVEYGYLTGVAATVSFSSPWEVSLFGAYTPLDATVNQKMADSLCDGYPLVQSIYSSGYHRTATEISKRHQLNETLFGANVTYRKTNWKIGMTGYRMLLDKYIQPGNYRYNYYYFKGHENSNLGLDAAYRYKNLISYGEFSVSQNRKVAALGGMDWLYGSYGSLGARVYHYDAWYWNLYADALSQGGYTRNEQGVTLTSRMQLSPRMKSESSLSWCRFPEMRAVSYAPSHAFDARLRLTRQLCYPLMLSVLYRFRRQDANVKQGGSYSVFPSYRHQLQSDLRYSLNSWVYGLRVIFVDYRLYEEHSRGYLIYGDARWNASATPLSLAFRLSAFTIDDYDARIYTVENGLAFDNNGLFFNHHGIRIYGVLHYDLNGWLSMAVKYSLTRYLDGSLFGSGYESLNTNHRQQWYLQARLKL